MIFYHGGELFMSKPFGFWTNLVLTEGVLVQLVKMWHGYILMKGMLKALMKRFVQNLSFKYWRLASPL